MSCIQLDAVPAVVRTQYMPVYSRMGLYSRDWLDSIAYQKDRWYESFSHEACLLPVQLHPLMRWSSERAKHGELRQSGYRLAQEQPAYVKRVYKEVRDRGPLCARELNDPGIRKEVVSGWATRSAGMLALDYLFRIGELGIRRIGNFEKQFDLTERIIPANILRKKTPTEEQALKELLLISARALGVASADELIDYFRIPNSAAKPLIDELSEDGQLEAVRVEGYERPAYKVPGTRVPRAMNVRALVSPFDPICWNRKRDMRLFEFDYRLEIYTPANKRRWGYYVLPFLMGDRFVGRADVSLERDSGALRVLAAHIEEHGDEEAVANGLAQELQLMLHWVDGTRVVVGRRGKLSAALRSALKNQ
jgi:uncharacterized protein YcaQ